jgi:hypothetical protein
MLQMTNLLQRNYICCLSLLFSQDLVYPALNFVEGSFGLSVASWCLLPLLEQSSSSSYSRVLQRLHHNRFHELLYFFCRCGPLWPTNMVHLRKSIPEVNRFFIDFIFSHQQWANLGHSWMGSRKAKSGSLINGFSTHVSAENKGRVLHPKQRSGSPSKTKRRRFGLEVRCLFLLRPNLLRCTGRLCRCGGHFFV